MRIWDLPVSKLCRNHLLGEHRELHAIWTIIIKNKIGYANHPETTRWRGKLKALYIRHTNLVNEMKKRGYNHHSYLDKSFAKGKAHQDILIDTIESQKKILKKKNCLCKVQ